MIFRVLKEDDIELIAQKYMDYHNTHEEGCWTIEKAKKRVGQMIRIDDSMCFALFEQGEIIGFVLGFYLSDNFAQMSKFI